MNSKLVKSAISLAVLCLIVQAPARADVIGVIVGGAVTKNVVTEITDQLNSVIAQAAVQGNFLVEKSARELQLLLANGDTVLQNNLDKTFDGLTQQQKTFLKGAAEMTDKLSTMSSKMLEVEQFAAMDLNTVLGSLPGVDGNKFLLRSVSGYSQAYKEKGVYRVKLVGQAFKNDRRVLITIDGKPIRLLPFSTDYVATAEIPVELLAEKFADDKVNRIPIKIQSWSKRGWLGSMLNGPERNDLNYDSQLLLLPKKPVTYELVEQTAGKGWSPTVSTLSNTAIAAATGASGNWRSYGVSVTIPPGTKMLPERTRCWIQVGVPAGSWGYWSACNQLTDNDINGPRTASGVFAHQIHDQNRTLAIEASYVTPVTIDGRNMIKLQDPVTAKVEDKALAFDNLYQAKFSSDYSTYFLRLTYFNGNVITVGATTPNPPGIEVSPSITATAKTVTVKLKNPYDA